MCFVYTLWCCSDAKINSCNFHIDVNKKYFCYRKYSWRHNQYSRFFLLTLDVAPALVQTVSPHSVYHWSFFHQP